MANAQQNYPCESCRDIIQYLRGKYLDTTLVVKLGKFSDLRQRLYCPFCRLLVTSVPLAPRINEWENIKVSFGGRIECNALPLGIHIRKVHSNEEQVEFRDGRIFKENQIDVRSPFPEIIATRT